MVDIKDLTVNAMKLVDVSNDVLKFLKKEKLSIAEVQIVLVMILREFIQRKEIDKEKLLVSLAASNEDLENFAKLAKKGKGIEA